MSNVIINIFSIMLLIILLVNAVNQTEKKFIQDKLFILMLQFTMLLLIIDILARFDGHPGTIYSIINSFGNFTIYLLSPVLAFLWFLYADFQIYSDTKKISRLAKPLFLILGVNALLLLLSQFLGWYYHIDANNIYHRGPLFWLPATITISMIIMVSFLVLINRKKVDKKVFFSLMFFPVIPVIGIILQITFYGVSLMLNGVVASILLVFLNIQDRNLNTDYLTGAYNRKRFELYLKEKIVASSENKTFSAIMMDMDDFKAINDTFGHAEGDAVLEVTVDLIKNCLAPNDFLARFGGDEFFIILDTDDADEVRNIVDRIKENSENYNKHNNKKYNINLSVGFAVYDYDSNMNSEEFQKFVDDLMYRNKRINKRNASK